MTRMRITAIAITMLMLGSNAFGDDISPANLLKKVAATYEAAKTYKAEGMITSDIDTGAIKMKIETSFLILMKKPNLYLISWTQKNMSMPGMVQSGAVWSDGTQNHRREQEEHEGNDGEIENDAQDRENERFFY